jgi:hypothetical protein
MNRRICGYALIIPSWAEQHPACTSDSLLGSALLPGCAASARDPAGQRVCGANPCDAELKCMDPTSFNDYGIPSFTDQKRLIHHFSA